jgi:predicted methyltransferase
MLMAQRAWGAVALKAVLIASTTLACAHKAGDGPPQHYDDPKAMIGAFEDSSRDEWQMPDRVVRGLPIASKSSVIADIGAGSGYFTRRLAAEVPEGRVYAVDVDSTFEQYLLENREAWGTPNIEPRLALYEDPLLPAGEIDLVFTANTYSYIRDRTAYFEKVNAALKPTGRLAIVDFRPDATYLGDAAPEPKHRVSRETVVRELEAAGFVLEGEETFLPHQYVLVFKPTK